MLFRFLSFITMVVVLSSKLFSQSLNDLLPDSLPGWEKENPSSRIYNSQDLYDYIDGGAELYLSYGINNVISETYSKFNAGEIRVEIFDMIESKNAFGVFTHTRTEDEKKIWTGITIFYRNTNFLERQVLHYYYR